MSKVALITGASRGIGLHLVKVFQTQGFKVIATCRSPNKAQDLQSFLAQTNQLKSLPFQCDVGSDESIQDCVAKVSSVVDKVDVLVNNAGVSNPDHPDDPPSKMKRNEFLDIMNTNVAGVFGMTQAFLPLLEKSEEPRVINISSLLGLISECYGGFSATGYRCSKAALNMLNRCFSLEFPNITFAAIHPGWVQTDLGSAKNRKAPVTPEESASKVFDVAMNKVTKSDSGTIWSFQGFQYKNY